MKIAGSLGSLLNVSVVHEWQSLDAIHERIVQRDRIAPVQVKVEEAAPVGVPQNP